jgi:hypothetical protein
MTKRKVAQPDLIDLLLADLVFRLLVIGENGACERRRIEHRDR